MTPFVSDRVQLYEHGIKECLTDMKRKLQAAYNQITNQYGIQSCREVTVVIILALIIATWFKRLARLNSSGAMAAKALTVPAGRPVPVGTFSV